jgi:Cu/Zn superoxide dismutase
MKYKLFLATALVCMGFVACDKDDDDNNNIVEKRGLALSGNQEVPMRTTPATGTMDVSYNKTSRTLSFTVNWQNLTTAPVGSHIHGPAAKGVNAGVKFDFTTPLPKTASGTYNGSVVVDGTAIKEDSLLNGFYYVNIHTTTYPGGEIRGQIEF